MKQYTGIDAGPGALMDWLCDQQAKYVFSASVFVSVKQILVGMRCREEFCMAFKVSSNYEIVISSS